MAVAVLIPPDKGSNLIQVVATRMIVGMAEGGRLILEWEMTETGPPILGRPQETIWTQIPATLGTTHG